MVRCLLVTFGLMLVSRPTLAADAEPAPARPQAIGFQLDLFPTVVSAVNGKVGYAPQVWWGIHPVRLRLVGAHLEPPDALAFADEGFENPTTTALAAIIDYMFGERFEGLWACAGFELWLRTIEHQDVPGQADWSSVIGTVGAGYIWRFAGNFYLDPWLGAHWTLNPETVHLGPYSYDPTPIIANASVKVGVFADL